MRAHKSRILSSMPKDGNLRQRKHCCRNCGFDYHSHENTTTGEVCLAVYAGNHRGWVVDRDATSPLLIHVWRWRSVSESRFLRHGPCDACDSSDGLAVTRTTRTASPVARTRSSQTSKRKTAPDRRLFRQ